MLVAVLFFAGLAALYAVVYYLNHKTPIPAGCEHIKAECNGCHINSCGNHPDHMYEKRESI